MISRAEQKAQGILSLCGAAKPRDISIEDLIVFHNGIVNEKPLHNCDGRMIMKHGRSIVTINSEIEFPPKKRFVLAHELGHILLHGTQEATFSDDYSTLEAYKHGPQEIEANAFAAELLMPAELFKQACFRKKFSPDLIRELADLFNTSITSVVYQFIDHGNHPICAFYSKDGKIQYWNKTPNFWVKVPDRSKLAVPSDSVANEYYVHGRIYRKQDAAQPIYKTTWFELDHYGRDAPMFEYCVVTPRYNTVLSVVWEK